MILITGASGSAGGAVLQAAIASGLPVRAMYRSNADAAKAPAGVNTVIADFANPASLQGALKGIDTVFLVCGPVPELVQLESNMIDACKQAGVRHIVLNSAFGAGDSSDLVPWLVASVGSGLAEDSDLEASVPDEGTGLPSFFR